MKFIDGFWLSELNSGHFDQLPFWQWQPKVVFRVVSMLSTRFLDNFPPCDANNVHFNTYKAEQSKPEVEIQGECRGYHTHEVSIKTLSLTMKAYMLRPSKHQNTFE